MEINIQKQILNPSYHIVRKPSQLVLKSLCTSWSKPVIYTQQTLQKLPYAKDIFLFLILFTTFSITAEAYTIAAMAGSGGKIEPHGSISVNQNEDITFTIIPDNGYIVANIHTAGLSQGAASSYTFYQINTDSILRASFLPAANSIAETIYVDNTLSSDCLAGEYSIVNRDNSGNDGNAYTSIIKAANIAGPGDTVLIRQGTYHSGKGLNENDVLWPKHSGTAESPVIFKSYNSEQVIIGRGSRSWPDDNWMSIARGVITLRNVSHIKIEGLTFDYVSGWLFARNCNYITIKDCKFENATYGAKGGARIIECLHFRFINNIFYNSSFDALMLIMSNYNLIENNTFNTAGHSLLTLRSSSYNAVKNNHFQNPRQKLIEVYDQKVDIRVSVNPSYIPIPGYNNTHHNLFENNLFGFQPFFNRAAQPSAMQYSGQSSIIRNNLFSNPLLKRPESDNSNRTAGGSAITMRWGGSWSGWNGKRIIGEGHEAGYVTHNRIYNNVFNGYDFGKVIIPYDDIMKNIPNPPPMKNVADFHNYLFDEKYAFEDNIFKNNIFCEGSVVPHINWTYLKKNEGMPVQLFLMGRLETTYFYNNNFFSSGQYPNQLIYDHVHYPNQDSKAPDFFNMKLKTFSENIQQDPLFIDVKNNDFHLQSNSSMIDAGDFLTFINSPDGTGSQITVEDPGYFYDGYDIVGEQGDLIKLESGQTARILDIDYTDVNNKINLDRRVSWSSGEKLSLNYLGAAPDIGAYEYIPSDIENPRPVLQKIGDKIINENVILTFTVNATDPNGELITYSVQNLPSGATFINRTFTWTPNYNQSGSYQVRFIASDGNSQDSETITINVKNVNRAPILGTISH